MNGTKLIWVVLLSFTFIVSILTTPISVFTNSQNKTTIISGNTTDSCPEELTGFCMNGGFCIYLEEQETVASECPDLYSGKRCEKFIWYLKLHVENVYIKYPIEHKKRLEEQRSLSAKTYTRDKRLIFRNYVFALCHEMAP